jgi:hypothetical protein
MKEIYWQQRVGKNWIIKGYSNSKFFHLYANEQGLIRDQQEIVDHVVSFYKDIFGPNKHFNLHLAPTF